VTPEPLLRASLLQLYLRELPYAVSADDLAAVRAALGPEAIARIEHTASFRWLPIALEVTMLRTLHERRGDEGVRALGRTMGHAAMRHAFLRVLLEASVLMKGRRPEALLEFTLKGYARATQHAGHPRLFRRGPREAVIRMENPPVPMRHRSLFERLGGSVEATLEEVGRVTVRSAVECDPGWAYVDNLFWWTPRAEGAAVPE
jgi:hypothetical protein